VLEIDIRHIGGRRTTERIEVVGYVSKSAHGEGRSSSDRQFFYVNSRPCAQPKIARTFNEIYRSYNGHQHPFILADFRLSSGTFDVNLSPDKRTILLHEEQALIKEISDQLTAFYDSFQHSLPISQFLTSKTPRRTERIKAESPSPVPGLPAQLPPLQSSSQQDSQPQSSQTESEFRTPTTRRTRDVVDLSSVEKTVSHVPGEFKERLATYALHSPEGRGLDATMTPVPEVSFPQSSPTLRKSQRLRRESQEEEEEEDADEEEEDVEGEDDQDEEEEEEGDGIQGEEEGQDKGGEVSDATRDDDTQTKRRRDRRTLTTIITPSQLDEITSRPSKRARVDDEETTASIPSRTVPSRTLASAAPAPRGLNLVQTTLKDRFLRKADKSEVRGSRGDEGLGILSQEQLAEFLSAAGDEDEVEADEEDEIVDDEEESGDAAEVDEEMPDEPQEPEEDDESPVLDEPMDETGEDTQETEQDPLPEQSRNTKSSKLSVTGTERNLFKSRTKNTVHNLNTTANVTLDTIRSQFASLKNTHTPSSQRGPLPGKEYAISNEKAEERLSLTVSKEDFARMRTVGQFNLGFIIAVQEREKDGDEGVEDVFIIDQHASDEKYNFERLQAETVMQYQLLARYPSS